MPFLISLAFNGLLLSIIPSSQIKIIIESIQFFFICQIFPIWALIDQFKGHLLNVLIIQSIYCTIKSVLCNSCFVSIVMWIASSFISASDVNDGL